MARTQGQIGDSLEGQFDGLLPSTDAEAKHARAIVRQGLFPGDAPPTKIGRFTVLKRLGAGQMGVVFLAYDGELDRKVAIKVLHGSGHSEESQGRARLVREAQALAQLSHPNVVGVYEAGVVDGSVFIVMEYVIGENLRQWLASGSRGRKEILGVFLQAGEGLACAHAAGFIHRDFKPDNVLVGADGRVRVLDFGLATRDKGWDSEEAGSTEDQPRDSAIGSGRQGTLTSTGAVVGSPAYMAPDQLRGEPSDASSDQFGFCVTLFEALSGRRPFAGSSTTDVIDAIDHRRIEPGPNATAMGGRLLKIVTRGLEPAPAERWPSMEALLDALTRVHAPSYRGVWLGLAVLGLGALTANALILQPDAQSLCDLATDRLAGVWDPAQQEAIERAFTATAIPYATLTWTTVQQRIDGYATRWLAGHQDACEATHVRGEQSTVLLDRRMLCLAGRHAHLAALSGVLAEADARTVEYAVQAASWLPPVENCADLEFVSAQVEPPDDPETGALVADSRARLANVAALIHAGKYDKALPIAQQVLSTASELGYEPLGAEALLMLGKVQLQLGTVEDAKANLSEAAWSASAINHNEIAAHAAVSLVSLVGDSAGLFDQGEHWSKDAAASIKRGHLENTFVHALLLAKRGTMHQRQGRYAEAHDDLSAALDALIELVGDTDTTVGSVHNNLANVLILQGDFAAAEPHLERALEIWESEVGSDHPMVADGLGSLGNSALKQGRFDEAKAYYERSIEGNIKARGSDHPNVGVVWGNLGIVFQQQGELDRARECFEKGLAIHEKHFGPRHSEVARALSNLGTVLKAQGREREALEHTQRALDIDQEALGLEHPSVAFELTRLGELLIALQRPAEAIDPLDRALKIRRDIKAESTQIAFTSFILARALWDAATDRKRARELALDASERFERAGPIVAELSAEVDAWLQSHVPG